MKFKKLLHPRSLAKLEELANLLKMQNKGVFSGNHPVYTIPKGAFGPGSIRAVWPDAVIIVCSPEEAERFYSPSEPAPAGTRIKFLEK